MSITFNNPSKSQKTVNKLLAKVLPGYTTTSSSNSKSTRSSSPSSTSQQLTSSHNSTTSHKILKQQKKSNKKAIKISQEQRAKLVAEARQRILEDHLKQGKLTKEESLELKKNIKKNVVDVQSWQVEDEREVKDVQREILELKEQGKKPKGRGVGKKNGANSGKKLDVYKKEMIRYPGLTPGLAPVGATDDEESDEE